MLNMEQRVIFQERVKISSVKNYFTITCKRLIKVFVYQNVAILILVIFWFLPNHVFFSISNISREIYKTLYKNIFKISIS